MKKIEFVEDGLLKNQRRVNRGDVMEFPGDEANAFVVNGVARHVPDKKEEFKKGGEK